MECKGSILVVEDEPAIAEAIDAYLKTNGYNTRIARDGREAIDLFFEWHFDMVILDLMIPYISGEEVCETIRQKSDVPIIMLTAKTLEDDKIAGLYLGADDYVTKPFSPRELMARVDSLLRRCKPFRNVQSWNGGDLVIDHEGKEIKVKGEIVNLTPYEFKLLELMSQNPNQAFTRERLIELAFGYDYEGFDRTVDSHIKNLRSKIEKDSSEPIYIQTVRGVGYKFGGKRE